MRGCCGYLFGARCRLFAYSPDDASAIPKLHHLLPQSRPVLPFLYWKRLTQVVLAIKRVCCSSISCRHTAVEMSQSVCCTAVVGTCLSICSAALGFWSMHVGRWRCCHRPHVHRHLVSFGRRGNLRVCHSCLCLILVAAFAHFHPSLSPVVSLSLGILHEWITMQMLAKPCSNLLQRTGGDHRGGRTQPGWRTFMMTCLRWILGYMKLEIWHKIGLSADWCLCTVLCTRTGACYYWIRFAHMPLPSARACGQ